MVNSKRLKVCWRNSFGPTLKGTAFLFFIAFAATGQEAVAQGFLDSLKKGLEDVAKELEEAAAEAEAGGSSSSGSNPSGVASNSCPVGSTEFSNVWGEGEEAGDLARQVFASIQNQFDTIRANNMRRLNGEQVPDWADDFLQASSWEWANTYFKEKAEHPSWGHEEWKLAAVPALDCRRPSSGSEINKCAYHSQLNAAIDEIDAKSVAGDDIAEMVTGIIETVDACKLAFEDMRPSIQRSLSSSTQMLCETSYLKGLIKPSMSKEEVTEASRAFWIPKIPSEVELGEWGVLANLMMRIHDVSQSGGAVFFTIDLLNLNPNYLTGWNKNSAGSSIGLWLAHTIDDNADGDYLDCGWEGPEFPLSGGVRGLKIKVHSYHSAVSVADNYVDIMFQEPHVPNKWMIKGEL